MPCDNSEQTSSGVLLGDLAAREGLAVRGDADLTVHRACALEPGQPGGLTFAEQPRQRASVAASQAAAAVLPAALADAFAGSVIVAEQPRLMFARLARAFEPAAPAGIATTAHVAAEVDIGADVHIGPGAVVERHAVIADGVVIEAGAVIGAGVVIGQGSRIGPRAAVLSRSWLGARVTIAAGAVIGERGFGLVPGPDGLESVPQLGGVRIDDDVEIGANTTIDRGALDDTAIHTGAKIDNQVHVAHNCVVGEHTVIAGCTGIAGSSRIGAGCMIGGGVGIGDHVTIADGTTITAASQIPKNIDTAGVYSSTFRAMPAGMWRRRLALFRALDRIEARLRRVETHQRPAGDTDE